MHQDGKYEVIFPVAVPDEGTFDWLDDFLDKNPKYVEQLGPNSSRILELLAEQGERQPADCSERPGKRNRF